ncbi:MAG: phosphoribosyltransferase [Nocardioides sp.]|uniref:phosphoribosyltransferase n=1 Tax=Nocardioides sp. TaxID=35761 RepID=UPI00326529DD
MADLDAGPDQSSQTIEIKQLDGFEDDGDAVLFVSVPASSRGRGVDNLIANLSAEALHCRVAILGVHPWRREMLDEDAYDDIARRVLGAPIYVLEHDADGRPHLRHVHGDAIENLDDESLLSHLRQAEVMAVLTAPGAYLPANDRVHYVGPNGQHYGAFLRPGFALTSNHRLDRVAFWLLPWMRGRRNIVVDHWSLLALAHHAAAYAARHFLEDFDVYVESLRGYETRESLAPRLRRSLPRTEGAALFLLSINSTGSLAHDVVIPALEGARQTGAAAVALGEASSDEGRSVDALAVLDETFKREDAEGCGHCSSTKFALHIDRDTFLMQMAAYTEFTAVTRADARPSTKVIEAYRDLGAFNLHRDYTEEGQERHHAFFVDVEPMLATQRFKKRLMAAVATLDDIEPSVIVCPPSDAATALAHMTAELLGVERVIRTSERGLRSVVSDDFAALRDAEQILLVDDVVITGRRIKAFRQELIKLKRDEKVSGAFSLGCLVGVARPRDAHALRGATDHVHHLGVNQTFAAVETLYLPNWDQSRCPWCQELRMLDVPEVADLELDYVASRLDALRATGGLTDPFFSGPSTHPESIAEVPTDPDSWETLSRSNKGTAQYGDQYWELNPGSVFGDVQGADLMMSVAAAVQGLRAAGGADGTEDSRLDTVFRSPVAKVLHPDLYLFGRFYEPVLLAAILRACNSWDLRTPEFDEQLEVGIRDQLEFLSSGQGLMAEAIVHGAARRLPVQHLREIALLHDGLAPLARTVL